MFEVEDDHTQGGSVMTLDFWADEANHWVKEDLRGRGIGRWSSAKAARACAEAGHHPAPPDLRG